MQGTFFPPIRISGALSLERGILSSTIVKSPDSPLSERRPPSILRTDEAASIRSKEDAAARPDNPLAETAPWERRTNKGMRNLLLGALVLVLALGLLGQAIYLAGAEAAIPMGAALLAVVTLFVVSRLRLLRQRNGGFLALGLVCLVAAAFPLARYAWEQASNVTPQPASGSGLARVDESPTDGMPLLTATFTVPPAEAGTEKFKVLRDFQVEMADGKTYLIKSGEILPLAERAEGEVRFSADNQKIGLPEKMIEMVAAEQDPDTSGLPVAMASTQGATAGPDMAAAGTSDDALFGDDRPLTPAQITERAQKEAIRRYPALGERESPENQLFIETFQELKHTGADDFFADPEWPLHLADMLAKRNWQRE